MKDIFEIIITAFIYAIIILIGIPIMIIFSAICIILLPVWLICYFCLNISIYNYLKNISKKLKESKESK